MSPKIFEKVQKKSWGAGCITCSPNNFVLPVPAPMAVKNDPSNNYVLQKQLFFILPDLFLSGVTFMPLFSSLTC